MNTLVTQVVNPAELPPGQWAAGRWECAAKTDPDRRPDPRDLPWVDRERYDQWLEELRGEAA